ncbi:MAG: CDP-glycerol glycerophosphotransferase family protein [Minisyncoccia bacterium]
MKTIFITVYDGDTEKVILRSGVFERLKASGNRLVLLVRVPDRLPYYKEHFEKDNVIVELLPGAMTKLEALWYHLGWNTLPTHSAFIRRYTKYRSHKNMVRYAIESLCGFLGNVRLWREFLRGIYALSRDSYCDAYFTKYTPDLVFTPNMFSPEDLLLLRAAKRRGIPTIATAKSWDVLTTKAFTRVKADRLLVFNDINRQEAVKIGDYAPSRVVVTGFPQFDVYARDDWKLSREVFCKELGLDREKRIILVAVPGDWKTPYTKEILAELDRRIEAGHFPMKVQVLARLHPKYADGSEGTSYRHIVMNRPGTHFSSGREFSIDMGIANVYQWTFTDKDIAHLANSIFHSDVIVNTESTLTLDGAALGKPTVLIAYEGNHTLPYWDSVARIYEREHYRSVVQTGAAPLVKSHDELETTLSRFLKDPEYLKEERALLTTKLLYKTDGHSAERTAEAVLSLLS